MVGAILSLAANALAVIVVAAYLPNRVGYESWTAVGIFALIVGVLNATVRPAVKVLTAPIGCLTLGLFSIVINGAMFWLAAQPFFRFGEYYVNADFLGALITSLVAALLNGGLNALVRDND
jgi:putative membrane protein